MKSLKILIIVVLLLSSVLMTFAQAPDGFNYQAVVRDGSGDIVASGIVGVQFTIRTDSAAGTVVYQERQTLNSNAYGLITAIIGQGTPVSGKFVDVDWASGSHFFQVEADPLGGANYSDMGTTQFMSVPYAQNAKTADALSGGSASHWTKSGDNIYNNNSGNVGIGTSNTSNSSLTLRAASGGRAIKFEKTDGSAAWEIFTGNDGMDFCETNVGCARLHLSPGGNIGIGTSKPRVPLDIATQGSMSISKFAFYNNTANPAYHSGTQNLNDISLVAKGRVVALEFDALSDARIKNIIDRTDNTRDLAAIRNIQITNYKFIDVVENDPRTMKKVIAQELEEVYPNAVNKMIGIVPNIYQSADMINGEILVDNELKSGDRVKLIFEDETATYEVISATPNSIKVDSDKSDKVFVYGAEVDDLRTVDYEALTTLNISATQELAKQIETLQAENNRLKAENTNFKEDINTIKAHLGLDLHGSK